MIYVFVALCFVFACAAEHYRRKWLDAEERLEDSYGSAADLPVGDHFIADLVYPKGKTKDGALFFGNIRRADQRDPRDAVARINQAFDRVNREERDEN